MKPRWVGLAAMVCLFFAVVTPRDASAQAQGQEAGDLINLFFDCQTGGCYDPDFFRRELPFVNWVVDRQVADVHVLVTSQTTGGGGRAYTIAFLGLEDFEGEDQELTVATAGDATSDEQREALVEKVKLGLVRYVQGTSAADRLRVTYGIPGAGPGGPGGPGGPPGGPGPGAVSPEDDPWNFWVFSISGNGFVNGESTTKFSSYYGSVQASRTTEAWKASLSGNYNEYVQQYEIPQADGTTEIVKQTRKDWGTNGLLVRSVGPQWSIGLRAEAGSSTYYNQDLFWSLKPGIEYNFFPYSESSRRSLTLQYLVGPNGFDYKEQTIFLKTSETRPQQALTARLQLVQPWGRWSTSVTGSQYLHDTSKYNVDVSGNFNIRLFRGFSIRLSGNYVWLRDQLYISAAGATPEEILLRQRQLSTSYRYFTSFGIEYRFGSIFNNVVNPRFGSSGGSVIFF